MVAEDALRLKLLADADVIAITTRIYPMVLSQDAVYPAIAYRLDNQDELLKLDSEGHTDLVAHRFLFFSTTDQAHGGYDTARDLASAIRSCLGGFVGSVTNSAATATYNINGIFHIFTRGGYEDKTQTYQFISEYQVWGPLSA